MKPDSGYVILSSDDWNSGLKTSKYHVAVRLAEKGRVLFVNSIGLRNPTPGARDLLRIFRKLREWFRGPRQVKPGLFVYTPLVIPFHSNALARKFNAAFLCVSINLVLFALRIRRPVVFIFTVNFLEATRITGMRKLIYYCIDEHKEEKGADAAMIQQKEKRLLEKADGVLCCSQSLTDRKAKRHPRTLYMPHGVDWKLFSSILRKPAPPHASMAVWPRPVIGFYGFMAPWWVDFNLVRHIAKARPQWSLVFIGPTAEEDEPLPTAANIHYLPAQPFETLPLFSAGFDVAMIPFVLSEYTRHCNPLKAYEYLASGLPVVATAIPELRKSAHLIHLAENQEDFIPLIEKALTENSVREKASRSEAVRREDWDNRIARILDFTDAL